MKRIRLRYLPMFYKDLEKTMIYIAKKISNI